MKSFDNQKFVRRSGAENMYFFAEDPNIRSAEFGKIVFLEYCSQRRARRKTYSYYKDQCPT